MKVYRFAEEYPVEKKVNELASLGFRAVLMAYDKEGLLTVLMEKEVEEPAVHKN